MLSFPQIFKLIKILPLSPRLKHFLLCLKVSLPAYLTAHGESLHAVTSAQRHLPCSPDLLGDDQSKCRKSLPIPPKRSATPSFHAHPSDSDLHHLPTAFSLPPRPR